MAGSPTEQGAPLKRSCCEVIDACLRQGVWPSTRVYPLHQLNPPHGYILHTGIPSCVRGAPCLGWTSCHRSAPCPLPPQLPTYPLPALCHAACQCSAPCWVRRLGCAKGEHHPPRVFDPLPAVPIHALAAPRVSTTHRAAEAARWPSATRACLRQGGCDVRAPSAHIRYSRYGLTPSLPSGISDLQSVRPVQIHFIVNRLFNLDASVYSLFTDLTQTIIPA